MRKWSRSKGKNREGRRGSQGEGVRVRQREGWKKSERKTVKKRLRRSSGRLKFHSNIQRLKVLRMFVPI